jgi:hypothetical protein
MRQWLAFFTSREKGIDARVVDASELLYYEALPKSTAVVLVSRSGRTAEMVRVAERLREMKRPYIAVTKAPRIGFRQLETLEHQLPPRGPVRNAEFAVRPAGIVVFKTARQCGHQLAW